VAPDERQQLLQIQKLAGDIPAQLDQLPLELTRGLREAYQEECENARTRIEAHLKQSTPPKPQNAAAQQQYLLELHPAPVPGYPVTTQYRGGQYPPPYNNGPLLHYYEEQYPPSHNNGPANPHATNGFLPRRYSC